MKEIGGYIEFEHYDNKMLHENAIKLNCGRNALAYLIETKNIKKIAMPLFMCDSCESVFKRYGIEVSYYSINIDFKPKYISLKENEWLYVVNFYGQLSNEYFIELKKKYSRLIVDNAQAYFQEPVAGIDTLYTCRKFFGVADGAILYSDKKMERSLKTDESFDRMRFLLGRFERTASEFYAEYVSNNQLFERESIKTMSKLTENLLRTIDYESVKEKRTRNFQYLQERLKDKNKLSLSVPEGAFMYPLYIENGMEMRKKLQQERIYIPTLWPNVKQKVCDSEIEYQFADNILPLPCDQRYDLNDMQYLVNEVHKCLIERIE